MKKNGKVILANTMTLQVKLTDVNGESIILRDGDILTKFDYIGYWYSDPLKHCRAHHECRNVHARLIMKTDIHGSRGLYLKVYAKKDNIYIPLEELDGIRIAQPRNEFDNAI